MKKIIKKAGKGKTTELVKIASENDYHIACRNACNFKYIKSIAEKLNIAVPRYITFNELVLENFKGKEIKGIVIDDVDELLRLICDGKLKGFSITE